MLAVNKPSEGARRFQFSSANISSTFASQPLLAGANPLGYVRGFLSPIQGVGRNYLVFPYVDTTQNFVPPLTSTLLCSLANLNEKSHVETQQVRLSVQYPSKNLNKTLHGS